MAPTIQDHVFSVPGAQAEILQRYNVFKNLSEIVYHPDNYDASVLVANKEEFMNEVKTAYKELATFTAGVITNVASSTVDKTVAQDFLSSSGREFSTFLNLYSRKCLQVQNRESLDPNQDRSNSGSDISARSEAEEKARLAKVDRDIDIVKMSDAIDGLRLEVNVEDDWSTADSNRVEIAMNNIASWRKKLSFVKNKFWDIQRNTEDNNLDEEELTLLSLSSTAMAAATVTTTCFPQPALT